MLETSRSARISRRISLHPLRKALILVACTAAGLIGLAAVPAAARAATGAPGAVPPNQAPRSAVALAFDPAGAGSAFYRGADNAVYMRAFSGAGPAWSAQTRIGGVIIGAPAATVARTTVVVAARGADNALWLRMMDNGTWGKWTSWGGVLSASPAITGGSDGRIDAFVRGADRALWTRTLRADGSLTAWKSLGGRLSTGPTAVTIQDNSLAVAAAGTDHAVWTTGTSGGWRSLGGRTYSAPALGYIPQSNGLFVLARGTDNALWANGLGGGASTGWRKIGGRLTDGPTAAGTREPLPHMIAAVIGTDHAAWTTRYPTNNGRWFGFTRAWVPEG
jgi:hypothetical protein